MLRFWIFFLAAVLLTAQDGAEALAILKKSCAGCHNVNSMSSGLSLDSKEAILQGGNRGPAAAVIVAAVKHAGDVKMPKGGKKLSDADVAIGCQKSRSNSPIGEPEWHWESSASFSLCACACGLLPIFYPPARFLRQILPLSTICCPIP